MKLLSKALIIPSLIATLGLFSCAGKKEKAEETAPEKVQTAFKEKFPQATDVEWGKESDTEWEAEFKMDTKEYSANFKSDGQWLETEYAITVNEIPGNIKTSMDSSFAGYNVEKAEVSEKGEGTFYEIKLKKGENEMELVYNNVGAIVKQKGATEEEEDGEKEDEDDEKDEKEEKGH